jgi:hypothetical protein
MRRSPLEIVLLLVALAVGAAVVLLAIAHADDRFGVDHVSGSWLALAAAAREGVLYPPLADDGFYGGTRWMPLPFLLFAGGDLVTGDLLTGAKLVGALAAIAVLALVALACRRKGAPWAAALALAAAVAASWAGTTVFLGIRGDAVSLALGLGAVAVLERRETRRAAAVAGALCGLAFLAKLSALWAPAALVAWQLRRSGQRAATVAAAFAGTSVASVLLVELLSRGRLSDNLLELAFAGSDDRGRLAGLRALYDLGIRDQRSLWPLLVAAGLVAALALVRRQVGPYELGLGAAVVIALVVLRDTGARENHLLDLTALAAIVAAGAWSPGLLRGRAAAGARVAVAGALVLAVLLAGRHTLGPPVRDVLEGDDASLGKRPLAGLVSAGDCLLAHDPTIPLLLGQRPTVVDPFMLPRLPGDEQVELARAIEERRFDRVALIVRPDVDPFRFNQLDFGPEVAEAIESSYRLVATVQTSPPTYVYVPRAGPREPCAPQPISSW